MMKIEIMVVCICLLLLKKMKLKTKKRRKMIYKIRISYNNRIVLQVLLLIKVLLDLYKEEIKELEEIMIQIEKVKLSVVKWYHKKNKL